MIHSDLYGDDHEVTAGVDLQTGDRTVGYDLDRYTPAQARALAADIIGAANVCERRLIAIPRSGSCDPMNR